MPIRTYWYDDAQTIYITEVVGTWTMDDFYQYFEDVEALMKTIPHDVVLISDMSKSDKAPKQLLSAGRFMSTRRIPNVRLTITSGVSKFGQMLTQILARTYPSIRRGKLAHSMEEAIQMAQEALEEVKVID